MSVERDPIRIASTDADLLALAQGIARFAVVELPTTQAFIASFWFVGRDGVSGVVHPESHDIIDWFEVFPLVVRCDGPVPTNLNWEPWPFEKWSVEVLRRMDWLSVAPTQAGDQPVPKLKPGEAPKNAHRQLVDVGLLFTDERGGRMIVASDPFPLTLVVTRSDHEIDAFLADCSRLKLSSYMGTKL